MFRFPLCLHAARYLTFKEMQRFVDIKLNEATISTATAHPTGTTSLSSQITIIDVRTLPEVEALGSIAKAIHIPLGILQEVLEDSDSEQFERTFPGEVKPNPRSTSMVFFCSGEATKRSDRDNIGMNRGDNDIPTSPLLRCEIAATEIAEKNLDFNCVYVYKGGYSEWDKQFKE
eukprot:Tbor_TRINITY_DN6003_c0_g5::TRINITY_DN6003_c0_g5_i1::g.11610::m.11610